MSTQWPQPLALPSSPTFCALQSQGLRLRCLYHPELDRLHCTFCIDADTEHTHAGAPWAH